MYTQEELQEADAAFDLIIGRIITTITDLPPLTRGVINDLFFNEPNTAFRLLSDAARQGIGDGIAAIRATDKGRG